MEYVQGMPDLLVITQGANRIEMTGPECQVLRYVMSEFKRFGDVIDDAMRGDDD
jgi:hypothetical protein